MTIFSIISLLLREAAFTATLTGPGHGPFLPGTLAF
jgi:hypothetical protein